MKLVLHRVKTGPFIGNNNTEEVRSMGSFAAQYFSTTVYTHPSLLLPRTAATASSTPEVPLTSLGKTGGGARPMSELKDLKLPMLYGS